MVFDGGGAQIRKSSMPRTDEQKYRARQVSKANIFQKFGYRAEPVRPEKIEKVPPPPPLHQKIKWSVPNRILQTLFSSWRVQLIICTNIYIYLYSYLYHSK